MKSIRSRITLSYMLMFLGLWFIAGVFSFFYVRKAIFLHSTNSMNFLLGQKIALFDDSFEEIKENVQSLSSQIPNSSKFDETFYEKLKEKAVIAFYDQKLVKTFFFCPNPDTTASSKCLYLLSLKNSNNFRRSLFIDLSFDTSVNDKGTKERIPWYYKARENRNPAWFGAYKSYNIEDAAMVISYIIPVYAEKSSLA